MARRGGALSKVAGRIKKGALTEQARRAGMSISEFCASSRAKHGTAARRCALAHTFAKYRPKGRAAHRAAKKGARTRRRGGRR